MSNIEITKLDRESVKEHDIDHWSTWECEPSEFPWEYYDKETCYVFEGKVTIETEDGDRVEIEAGDFVVFPKGLKCKWTVHQKIRKVYKFE